MRIIFTVIIVLALIGVVWFMISPWFKKIGGAVKDAHDDLKENLSDDDDDDVEDEHDKYASSERAIAPHSRPQRSSFVGSAPSSSQQEEARKQLLREDAKADYLQQKRLREEADQKAREKRNAELTRQRAEQAKQRLEEDRRRRQREEEADRQRMDSGYPYIGNPTWGAYVSEDDSSRHHSHGSHHDSSSSYDSGSSNSSSSDSSSSSYDSGSSSSFDSGSSDSGSW